MDNVIIFLSGILIGIIISVLVILYDEYKNKKRRIPCDCKMQIGGSGKLCPKCRKEKKE